MSSIQIPVVINLTIRVHVEWCRVNYALPAVAMVVIGAAVLPLIKLVTTAEDNAMVDEGAIT